MSVGSFQTLPGRNELLWGGCEHRNVAQARPGAPAGEGLAPVYSQWGLCRTPALQPRWRGQRGCSVGGVCGLVLWVSLSMDGAPGNRVPRGESTRFSLSRWRPGA